MFALKLKLTEKSVISLFLFLTQFGLISSNLPLGVVVPRQGGRLGWRELGMNMQTPCLEAPNNIRGKNNLLGSAWVFF